MKGAVVYSDPGERAIASPQWEAVLAKTRDLSAWFQTGLLDFGGRRGLRTDPGDGSVALIVFHAIRVASVLPLYSRGEGPGVRGRAVFGLALKRRRESI